MRGFRRITRQLICAHCDALIGEASYRPLLSWRLHITAPDGTELTPLAGSIQLRLAEQQLRDAPAEQVAHAQWRVDFINRHLAEVLYDLPCPDGHHTLMSAPQIARAMHAAHRGPVKLAEAA